MSWQWCSHSLGDESRSAPSIVESTSVENQHSTAPQKAESHDSKDHHGKEVARSTDRDQINDPAPVADEKGSGLVETKSFYTPEPPRSSSLLEVHLEETGPGREKQFVSNFSGASTAEHELSNVPSLNGNIRADSDGTDLIHVIYKDVDSTGTPTSTLPSLSIVDEVNIPSMITLTAKSLQHRTQNQPDETETPQETIKDSAQAAANPEHFNSNFEVIMEGSLVNAPADMNRIWEGKYADCNSLIKFKLSGKVDKTKQPSSTYKENEEMREKLAELQEINEVLKTEVAESRRNQVELIKSVNKLLERLDEKDMRLSEKDHALSKVTIEKNELVEKLVMMQMPKNQLGPEMEGLKASQVKGLNKLLGLFNERENFQSNIAIEKNTLLEKLAMAQGLKSRVTMKKESQAKDDTLPNVTTKENELSEKLRKATGFESDIQEAQANLLQLKASSAAAAPEPSVALLGSATKELGGELTFLPKSLKEVQGSIWEELQVDSLPSKFTFMSLINFDGVTDGLWSMGIHNGYRGFNWENVWVMHRSCYPGGGFRYGIVSGDYVAFNACVKPCSISSARPFSIAGFHATAAWNKDLGILVEGFDSRGSRVGSFRTTLGDPRKGPSFIDLRRERNFEGLYKLKITPSGGTSAGLGYRSRSTLVIDGMLVY